MKNSSFWAKFTNALFPKHVICDICGKELDGAQKAKCVCDGCLKELLPRIDERSELEGVTIFAPFIYQGAAKDVALSCKDGGKSYLARTMAYFIADCAVRNKLEFDCVCYVPSHAERKKARGFCHTEVIAEEASEILKKPVAHALAQKKLVEDQTKLTSKQRKENVAGAFECVNGASKGKRVLLVDDIAASGATISECAKALIRGGAISVTAVCFATPEFHGISKD